MADSAPKTPPITVVTKTPLQMDFFARAMFFCTYVLADVGKHRKRSGVADVVKNTVKLVGDGNARRCRRAVRVDGGGNDDVGKGVEHHLKTRRDADMEDVQQLFIVKT